MRNSQPPQEDGQASGGLYGWYVVIVLLGANILNFVDRKLPFILIESIKRDLHLSDTQVGLIGGVIFTGTYAISGLILAGFADRFSRKAVLAFSIFGWSLMTAVSGLARSFGAFAFARAGVAIGESGAAPPAHSIISDYFPARKRGLPMAVFSAGTSIGLMGGLMIGGIVNDLANWRSALFVVMGPGILLSIMVFLTIREPARGASDGLASATKGGSTLWDVAVQVWKKPSIRYLIIGAAIFSVGTSGVAAFAAAFFIRLHGLSTSQTGLWLGLAFGVGGGLGSVLGGYLSDRAGRKDLRFGIWAPLTVCLGAVPVYAVAFWVQNTTLAFVLASMGCFLNAFYVAPSIAAIHALVLPHMRAKSSAVLLLAQQGIGASIGPVAVGMLSDRLTPWAGVDALRYALLAALATYLVGIPFYLFAGRSMREDTVLGQEPVPVAV